MTDKLTDKRNYITDDLMFGRSIDNAPKQSDFFMHIHDKHEILCFVSGKADFVAEGNKYKLKPGCIAIARAAEGHRIIIKSDEPYERYVINFSTDYFNKSGFSSSLFKAFTDRKLGEKNVYYPDELSGIYPIEFFKNAMKDGEFNDKEDVFKSRLAVLLCSLNTAFQNKPKSTSTRFTDNGLIQFINQNLYKDISLEDISNQVHLSVSQMNRNFKKLTGSTVHNYIISKRLISAQIYINEGKSAAEACHLAGFKDYSSFFRIYKKRFGTAPTLTDKESVIAENPRKTVFVE